MVRALKARVVRNALLEKGFRRADKPNPDHEYYFFFRDGKKTGFHFKISLGADEVRRDEIVNNARQWAVRSADAYRIVCCELDAAATRELLEASLLARQ